MTALATVDDLTAVAGTVDETRAARLIEMASAVVERWCRRTFAQVPDDVITIRGYDGALWLPGPPVTALTSIVAEGKLVDASTYTWTPDGQITFEGMWWNAWANLWPSMLFGWPPVFAPAFTITYTHGYGAIPDDVIGVVCAMVGRTLATDIGIRNESLGSYSVRFDDTTGAGIVLSKSDKDALHDYRRRITSVPVAVGQ